MGHNSNESICYQWFQKAVYRETNSLLTSGIVIGFAPCFIAVLSITLWGYTERDDTGWQIFLVAAGLGVAVIGTWVHILLALGAKQRIKTYSELAVKYARIDGIISERDRAEQCCGSSQGEVCPEADSLGGDTGREITERENEEPQA